MSKYKYEGNSIKLNEYMYAADLRDDEIPKDICLFYGPSDCEAPDNLTDSSDDGSFLLPNSKERIRVNKFLLDLIQNHKEIK